MTAASLPTGTPPPATGELMRLEEARERMLAGIGPLETELVPLDDALGRVLAETLSSRLTLPPWDNSAMDGFAVRSMEVAGATRETPVELRVVGEVAAGHVPEIPVQSGTAVRILTGGMLPAGADAVVPVEDTDAVAGEAAAPATVKVFAPATSGTNIRRSGSDIQVGNPVATAGQTLGPASLALLAATGHSEVRVHRRPRVAVLSTGDELVPVGEKVGPAQIPDSNSTGVAAQARAAGAEVIRLGIAADRLDDVLQRLRAGIATADVVVISGGVSVGAHDFVKTALAQVGRLDLWRVAVQPGKPLAYGTAPRPDGREARIFGLPGNPVSSFVTFELFVRPVLRRLAGHTDAIGRASVRARLTGVVSTSVGRRAFVRVRLARDAETGGWRASSAGGQGSHVLSALAAADGLAIIPEEVGTMAADSEVEVLRLDDESR